MDECELPASSPAVPHHTQSQQDIAQEPALTAFNAFYRRFFPRLVTFLMWQGARLPDAAGITQVTMIKAHKHWSTIREPDAWARRVASRELARQIARIKEDPAGEIPEHSSLLLSLTNVAVWEQQHEVLRELSRLSLRQRQVMAWSLEGYTPAEIAKELKITSDTVLANLEQARKALAQHLVTTEDEQ